MKECNNICITKAGTEEWINFVEEMRPYWKDDINTKTDMTTLAIVKPPHIKVLQEIINAAKDRYGSLFGQFLLMEYGLIKLKNELNRSSELMGSHNLAKRTAQRFSLVVGLQIPSIDLQFYPDVDRDEGRVVVPITKKQSGQISDLSHELGFVFGDKSNVGLMILVCSIGDMLGLSCEGGFDKYCIEYANKLKEEIKSKRNVWNLFLRENLNKVFDDINSKIIYYKETNEPYSVKFDAKIRCAYHLVEFYKNNKNLFVGFKDTELIERKTLKFIELIEKYSDLNEMLKIPDRHFDNIDNIKNEKESFDDEDKNQIENKLNIKNRKKMQDSSNDAIKQKQIDFIIYNIEKGKFTQEDGNKRIEEINNHFDNLEDSKVFEEK